MKHKLSISNKSCNNHRRCGNKIVIAIIILLTCIERPFIACSSDSSSELLVVPEEALPNSNFVEKCEQRCYDQVGLALKKSQPILCN